MTLVEKTLKTTITRAPKRACYDAELIHQIIDQAIIGHLAFQVDGETHSIPMPFWRDNNNVFIHCSTQSRLAKLAISKQTVCISFTILDGLVLAKSAFHHSMNYRSVVLYGQFEQVTDDLTKTDALKKFMELFDKQRWQQVRKPNSKEMNATAVLKMPLNEVVAKVRQGPPADKKADLKLDVQAGVIPCYHTFGELVKS